MDEEAHLKAEEAMLAGSRLMIYLRTRVPEADYEDLKLVFGDFVKATCRLVDGDPKALAGDGMKR